MSVIGYLFFALVGLLILALLPLLAVHLLLRHFRAAPEDPERALVPTSPPALRALVDTPDGAQ